MPTKIISSKLISQSRELAGQVLELGFMQGCVCVRGVSGSGLRAVWPGQVVSSQISYLLRRLLGELQAIVGRTFGWGLEPTQQRHQETAGTLFRQPWGS